MTLSFMSCSNAPKEFDYSQWLDDYLKPKSEYLYLFKSRHISRAENDSINIPDNGPSKPIVTLSKDTIIVEFFKHQFIGCYGSEYGNFEVNGKTGKLLFCTICDPSQGYTPETGPMHFKYFIKRNRTTESLIMIPEERDLLLKKMPIVEEDEIVD